MKSPRSTFGLLRLGISSILALLVLAGCAGRGIEEGPPHLLLVTFDTTRADRIGAYGRKEAETPWIDRLAREGTLYENAWTTAPLTTPSHASMMTGLLPAAHGVRGNGRGPLSDRWITVAERLQEAGYETGAFVGAYPLTRPFGLARGFGVYDDDLGRTEKGPRLERPADEVTDAALAWLEAETADEGPPLFLWVHYYDPHLPWVPPEPFGERFRGRPYEGEIAFADAQLGRLVSAFEERGLLDRTAVVVVGDHGEGLGDHGETAHGILLYEETLRVPFVIRAPGRVRSRHREERLVSVVDVHPTLLGLAGLAASPALHGRDLTRDGEARPPTNLLDRMRSPLERERIVIAESRRPWDDFGWAPLFAARQGSLKWVEAPSPELYDLEADPAERDDLVGTTKASGKALADALEELLALLDAAEAEGQAPDRAAMGRLRSLGYPGAGGVLASEEPPRHRRLPDPKARIDDYELYVETIPLLHGGTTECARARAVLQTLVNSDPFNPSFRLAHVESLICLDYPGEAELLLRELLEDHPAFVTAAMRLAEILRRDGRAGEAIEVLEGLRERGIRDAAIAHEIAGAWLEAGEPERALEEALAALATEPDSVELLLVAGRAYEALARPEEAKESYRKILEVSPGERRALDALGSLGEGGPEG